MNRLESASHSIDFFVVLQNLVIDEEIPILDPLLTHHSLVVLQQVVVVILHGLNILEDDSPIIVEMGL